MRSAGSTWRGRVPIPQIAAEAGRAWRNLRRATERFRYLRLVVPHVLPPAGTTFSYGQVRTELRTRRSVHPYRQRCVLSATAPRRRRRRRFPKDP